MATTTDQDPDIDLLNSTHSEDYSASDYLLEKEFSTWRKSTHVNKLIYAKQCIIENNFKVQKIQLIQQSYELFKQEDVLPYHILPQENPTELKLAILKQEAQVQYLKAKEKILKIQDETAKIEAYINQTISKTLIDKLKETAISFLNDETDSYEEASKMAYKSHFENRTSKVGVQTKGKFLNSKDFNEELSKLEHITEVSFLTTPVPPKGMSYKSLLSVATTKQPSDFLSKKPAAKPIQKSHKKQKNSSTVKPTPEKMSRKRDNNSPVRKFWPKNQKRSPVKRGHHQSKKPGNSKRQKRH